ncbi:MAG: hypothetical protein ACOQNY_00550 [Mycoplasmoidaceae bacterium]
MRNTKSLNVALSASAIVVAFVMMMVYGISGTNNPFDFGADSVAIEWQYATFLLILLILGFLLMTVKIVYCSVMNLRDNGPEGYTIGGIVLDSIYLVCIILGVSLFIIAACTHSAEAVEAAKQNMRIIEDIAMPTALVSSICGGYLTKRCYGK